MTRPARSAALASLVVLGGAASIATPARAAGSEGRLVRDCAECPALVVVPAGRLALREAVTNDRGEPVPPGERVRTIAVARDFALGRYEVTRGEFARFVADSGHVAPSACHRFDPAVGAVAAIDGADWRTPDGGVPARHDEPVRCVSWNDANAYAAWLARRTGRPYRLPTVTEFQYAAQAGSEARFPWGDDLDAACAHANVFDRSVPRIGATPAPSANCDDGFAEIAPVGSFAPNAFGLHDMIGNVSEWLADCFPNSLERPDDGDPCARRGNRGGSWLHPPIAYRPGFPSRGRPFVASAIFGFRVARDLP